ncbi:hypothetical protein AKO1_009876 [Acrasis kona]|uniref:Peptidase S8/S53 domain-containing protein n=1 Tax=Acrasis kona TaxID=1008807 RepID=A0AAW2ZQ55_9EUKA
MLLSIMLFETTRDEAETISQEILDKLKTAGAKVINHQVTSKDKIILQTLNQQLDVIIQHLSNHHRVHWIEETIIEKKTLNSDVKWQVQTQKPNFTIFHDVGLDGTNQIVSFGDSGLDVNSCFFIDSDSNIPEVTPLGPPLSPEKILKHRKIAGYYRYTRDDDDDLFGHGTHIAGSISGNFQNTSDVLSKYNGIAYNSRIAAADYGCSRPGGCSCYDNSTNCVCYFYPNQTCPYSTYVLYPPFNYETDLLPWPYSVGARIYVFTMGVHTMSGYNKNAMEVDSFVYDNPDFLVLTAAGNEGNFGLKTLYDGPQQSKNTITVGASSSSLQSWMNVSKFMDLEYNTLQMFTELQNICKNHGNVGNACTMADRMRNATDCCFDNCTISQVIKQYGGADVDPGQQCCPECANLMVQNNPELYSIQNLSPMSSTGSCADGRTKPDVVAPGHYVVSAASLWYSPDCNVPSNNSQVRVMSGTSMATAVAAGAATIIRQYFVDGFYPSGVRKGIMSQFNSPSASLIKAVMIASASPLQGFANGPNYADKKILLKDLPMNQQKLYNGFGLINLINVLYLSGSKNNLWISDLLFVNTGDQYSVSIPSWNAPKDGTPMSVTLVWTDPPASPSSAFALVNDLDLVVVYNNITRFGNSAQPSDVRDGINNVEKVVLPSIDLTNVMIYVRGFNVAKPKNRYGQDFSLVVAGGSFSVVGGIIPGVVEKEVPDRRNVLFIVVIVLASLLGAAYLLLVVLIAFLVLVACKSKKKRKSEYELTEKLNDDTTYISTETYNEKY